MTPEIAAEAAVWVARLHGPDRSSRMQRECLEWQQHSEANRIAFERSTDTWQDVALVTLSAYATASSLRPERAKIPSAKFRSRMRWAMVAVMVVTAWMFVVRPWHDVERYSTEVGEKRVVILRDGSRISLNTGTRVRVEFSSAQRTVGVDDGEALFEVAKDASRPFVVRVARSEVVAVGTAFSVRLTAKSDSVGESLVVALIEGNITVRGDSNVAHGLAPATPFLMGPGDRVRLVEAVGAVPRMTMQMDRPRMDQVIAWRRNEAVFDDDALADAVSEMNRYSRRPIVLVGAAEGRSLRVSGLFQTSDNVEFANAVAALHGLLVHEYQDRLELVPR